MEAKLLAALSLLLVAGQFTATALPRSESAESTPAPSQQPSNSSSLCGNIPVLLHQQGRDGRDGRDGLQGPVGPSGMKGEKGDQGIQLQGADGQQGPVGPSGRKGEKGDQGIQLQGPPGLQGPTGLTGQKGATGPAGPPGPTAGGVVYTRWGRTTCPTTSGTQLAYAGRAAGSNWNQRGGGANYLCLPDNPNYLRYTNGAQTTRAYLYGAEYDTYDSAPLSAVLNHNVPCAVCYASTRGTVMMIPGKTVCPSSWTREYYGYLMAEKHDHHRSTFECVDQSPQSIPGSASDTNGALFYHVEARCAGICPPYTDGRELTCTVCTK